MSAPEPADVAAEARSWQRRWIARGARMTAAVGIGFFLALGATLYVIQDRMIYFPRRYPVADVNQLLPRGTERIEVTTPSGRRALAYLVLPRAPEPDAPIWFLIGGNASLALDWNEDVEQALRRRPGLTFVMMEYPGYGELFDGRRPSRAEIRPAMRDLHAAVIGRLGLSPEEAARRTHLFGFSLGSAIATELATDVGAAEVVLIAPFTSLKDMARRTVPPPYHLLVRDRWDTQARLAELAQRGERRPRVVIHHGDGDPIVPVSMGRRLAEAHPWVQYRELPGHDHESLLSVVFPKP